MKPETTEIFKSSVATLRYSEEHSLVYLTWNGTLTLEKYQEPFKFLLQDFKPEVYGILSDIRKQGIVGPEMRTWLQKVATPASYERGLRFYYVASDANVFKQYYVNTILKLLSGDSVERRMFADIDKAEQTLISAVHIFKSKIQQVA